jgi:hypothetical protein
MALDAGADDAEYDGHVADGERCGSDGVGLTTAIVVS